MRLFVPAHIPLLYRRFNLFSTGRALDHLSATSFKVLKTKKQGIKNKALFPRLSSVELGSALNALLLVFFFL
jgi:ABC-type polar amino acid transport system ATPase subunit